MFARVAIYDVPAERLAEAREGFKAAVAGIRDLRGLNDAYVLLSDESGRAVTITLWEDHDAMAASRVVASHLRSDATAAVDASVVSVDEFEVVEEAVPPPASESGPQT
jgi:heme-degrading monooxygenase HmoA